MAFVIRSAENYLLPLRADNYCLFSLVDFYFYASLLTQGPEREFEPALVLARPTRHRQGEIVVP